MWREGKGEGKGKRENKWRLDKRRGGRKRSKGRGMRRRGNEGREGDVK